MTTLTAPLPLVPARGSGDLGELTLGRRLDGAWQELRDHGATRCPLCGERMALAGDQGRCPACDCELR